MSVFAAQYPSFVPTYPTTTPLSKTSSNTNASPSPSTNSLPKSFSAISFSLNRIFSHPNDSNTSSAATAERSHFSARSSIDSSTDSLSTILTGTTINSSQHENTLQHLNGLCPPPSHSLFSPSNPAPTTADPISPLPPAYSPIALPTKTRTISRTTPIQAFAPIQSAPQIKPKMVAKPRAETYEKQLHSTDAWGWNGGWSKEYYERRARETREEREKEEGQCLCSSWWMISGTPSMPYVAYNIM
ncbi:hypothetical protein B0O99DRAFT_689673 [Bisporella sp. PMI_857]|nr:hypothetical protein B0O99DRAFT_689673 [Bisporella sp. PMI_857]